MGGNTLIAMCLGSQGDSNGYPLGYQGETNHEKVSLKEFMNAMNGKHVSLISACVVGKEVLEKALKSLDDTEKYNQVLATPVDGKYTGVFHKKSHGFYRVMANGDKSYKEFAKGDYILSDGTLSFILSTPTMRVCVCRVEN